MVPVIRVAAAGDLHASEEHRERIMHSFADLAERADLVLLAGDLTTHGMPEQAAVLADACRVVAPCRSWRCSATTITTRAARKT